MAMRFFSSLPNERLLRKAALLANLVLLLLIARSAAMLTWKLRGADSGPVASSGRPAVVEEARRGPELPGAAAMLFGSPAPARTAAPPPRVKKLPQTRLALVLKGTVVPTSGAPYAIVAAKKGGDEVVVSVGDKVPGGAVVERIYTDRIEIMLNGRLEVLKVEEGKGGRAAAVVSSSSAAAGAWKVPATYRKRWLNDLPALGRKVRAQPVKGKDGRVGFRLVSRDRNLLETVGLKSGDVVYEVNGISLSDPAQALKAAGELMKRKEVTVLFSRDGRMESRVYRLEE